MTNIDLSWNTIRPTSHQHTVDIETRKAVWSQPEFSTAWRGYSIEFNCTAPMITDEQRDEALYAIAERMSLTVLNVASVAMDYARSEDLSYEYSVGLG